MLPNWCYQILYSATPLPIINSKLEDIVLTRNIGNFRVKITNQPFFTRFFRSLDEYKFVMLFSRRFLEYSRLYVKI